MNDVFYGKPEPMVSKYEEEKQYVHAVCKCPVPDTFSIKIPRSFSSNGKYNFHCNVCGTEGVVILSHIDIGNGEKERRIL